MAELTWQEHAAMLRAAAKEMYDDGHAGWPNACNDAADFISSLAPKLDAAEKRLHTLLYQPQAQRDHMTSCDRIMGATHPCTCHADEYRALLEKL